MKEQITHYYPYGGVIGDISTLLSDVTKGNNENVQKYKLFHYIPREQARSEGKELDRTFGLDNYDIHARQYFAMAPMWDKPDSKAEDYYPISPYAYCGGDTVNNGDYNGEKIIFINGKIGGGSPPSGAEYWNGEHSSFVLQAQAVLNDNSVVFSTEDYGYLSTAEERRQQGYKYAKFNFEEWASNMNTDETFKLVSHSMGGAFSMGIEDYIKEQGREVEVNAMINTYQVDHIDIDATSSTVYIDYQNKNDPVLFWFDDNLGYGKLNNADIIIRESSNAKLLYIHRSPIDSGNFWETVRQCLNQK